jgi:superoxide reductase
LADLNQIFKCAECGDLLEVIVAGTGKAMCCGEDMGLLQAKTEDAGQEKHVPVIEKISSGVKVKVGSIPHPMEEKHWIQFIEIVADGKVYRKQLKPGDKPEAEFQITAQKIIAREFCNIHGLWKSK